MPKKLKTFSLLSSDQGIDQFSGTYTKNAKAADNIRNLHLDARGQWTTENCGYDTIGSQFESGASFDGLGWYRSSAGTDYLLGVINGKVLDINPSTGATNATLSTGFTAGNTPVFATFKGSVFIAEESVALQKWSGTGSLSAASGFPLTNGSETYDKPAIAEKYYNRLLTANFNGTTKYPSHVALSDDLDPESYTLSTTSAANGAVFQVNPGDGQTIQAVKTILVPGGNEQAALIFKEHRSWFLRGDSPATYELIPLNEHVGALNKRCVIELGDDVIVLDKNNIHSVTAAVTSGELSVAVGAIGSERVKTTLALLNTAASDTAWAVHLPKRRELWFAIPTEASTTPNKILVCYYSYNSQGLRTYAWSVRDEMVQTAALLLDSDFYTGSSDGYLNKWFGSSTYNGTAFTWEYEFPYLSFGAPGTTKRVVDLFASFLQEETHSITIETEWLLGGNSTSKTITKQITLPVGGAVYDTAEYDEAVFALNRYLKKVKIPVVGNGELLKIKVTGYATTNGVTFLGMQGVAEIGAESRAYR